MLHINELGKIFYEEKEMTEKLLVGVLGNRNSGKSHTWNSLFDRTVKTGKKLRKLYLNKKEYVEVFLVSGSPEERGEYVGQIISIEKPNIVLCSMQYTEDVIETIEWFVNNDYFLFIHWLNLGYKDEETIDDSLDLIPTILSYDSLLGIRNGKISVENRVQEMRDFVYGWANSRGLILSD